MHFPLPHEVLKLIGGYASVALTVGVENVGLPVPGETALIAASVYAGLTRHLNEVFVILSAAAGAIAGSSAGYWIGRQFGYRLLIRYGHFIRMTPPRIKLGQYLFLRYGARMVLIGRFVPILRSVSGFLAGANEMSWPRFSLYNALGAIAWAAAVGGVSFALAHSSSRHLLGPLHFVIGGVAGVAFLVLCYLLHRNEPRLIAEAERALPGPLTSRPRRRWRRP